MAKAILTAGTKLLRGESEEALAEWLDIVEYPDLIGTPGTVDVTTLSDKQQQMILDIFSSEVREFPCYMDSDGVNLAKAIETANTDAYYAVRFPNGYGAVWHGQHAVTVPGAGVSEAIQFGVAITNDSDVELKENIAISTSA